MTGSSAMIAALTMGMFITFVVVSMEVVSIRRARGKKPSESTIVGVLGSTSIFVITMIPFVAFTYVISGMFLKPFGIEAPGI